MLKIGLVIADEDSMLNDLGPYILDRSTNTRTYKLETYTLYVNVCGAGPIYAASATQMLIDRYEVNIILNCGVVGGLSDSAKFGQTYMVNRIFDYTRDLTAVNSEAKLGEYEEAPFGFFKCLSWLSDRVYPRVPLIPYGKIASGGSFISSKKNKEILRKVSDAVICDMESAAIALVCERNIVPCLILKSISDGMADSSAEEYLKNGVTASKICFDHLQMIINIIISEDIFGEWNFGAMRELIKSEREAREKEEDEGEEDEDSCESYD